MEDKILYHGSRGGIDGKIRPISRIRCDFGKGFYMGDSPEQAKGLVIEDTSPIFYTVNFKLSEIPENRILTLKDEDWLYTVLACRKMVDAFNELDIAKQYLKKLENYDVIIGSIADDRMTDAMKRFREYGLTDKGLMECLRAVKYGNQYVAKTEYACSKIDIISKREIYENENQDIRDYTYQQRKASKNIINQMSIKYQRNGKYLNEIIDMYKNLEKEDNDYENI